DRIGATPEVNHHAHLGVWVPWFVLLAFVATLVWLLLEDRAGVISLRSEPPAEPPTSAPSPAVRPTACIHAAAWCAFSTGGSGGADGVDGGLGVAGALVAAGEGHQQQGQVSSAHRTIRGPTE